MWFELEEVRIAIRIPTWAKRLAVMLVGFATLALVLARMVDYKRWLRSQLAIPHGGGGRMVARMMPMFHQVLYGPAAEYLDVGPDDAVIDVACGSGVFLDRHAGHVQSVAGIDVSEIQVDLARRRLRDRISSGSAEIVHGNATALPWDDNTFTAATCLGSLEFFPDPAAALREMQRVLRPGGRVVLTYGIDDTDEDCVNETKRWGLPHPSEAEARKLVEDAGFSLVSISYLDQDYLARFLQGVKPE